MRLDRLMYFVQMVTQQVMFLAHVAPSFPEKAKVRRPEAV